VKHIKSFNDWVSEKEKLKQENIVFWAGSQPDPESDDPDLDKLKRSFKVRDKQISRGTNFGRKTSYI
jgi:hypothetical protein